MNYLIKLTVWCITIYILSSCASLAGRIERMNGHSFNPGDGFFSKTYPCLDGMYAPKGQLFSINPFLIFLYLPVACIDIPVSASLDTALLPFDWVHMTMIQSSGNKWIEMDQYYREYTTLCNDEVVTNDQEGVFYVERWENKNILVLNYKLLTIRERNDKFDKQYWETSKTVVLEIDSGFIDALREADYNSKFRIDLFNSKVSNEPIAAIYYIPVGGHYDVESKSDEAIFYIDIPRGLIDTHGKEWPGRWSGQLHWTPPGMYIGVGSRLNADSISVTKFK